MLKNISQFLFHIIGTLFGALMILYIFYSASVVDPNLETNERIFFILKKVFLSTEVIPVIIGLILVISGPISILRLMSEPRNKIKEEKT